MKLELNGLKFSRTHRAHLYHFGSAATKNGKEGEMFKQTENPAAQVFMYKWCIPPQLFKNNSHNPKNGIVINGINTFGCSKKILLVENRSTWELVERIKYNNGFTIIKRI